MSRRLIWLITGKAKIEITKTCFVRCSQWGHAPWYVRQTREPHLFVAFSPFQTGVLRWFQFQSGAHIEDRIIRCYNHSDTEMFSNSRLTSFRELCIVTLISLNVARNSTKLWLFKFWVKEPARSNFFSRKLYALQKELIVHMTHDPSNLSWSPLQVKKCFKIAMWNMLHWLLQVIATSSWCWLTQWPQFFLTFYFRLHPTKTRKATLGFCSSCTLFTVTSAWMFQIIS